jgi:lysophospholipid acyltransferase (LPLAT)-like uncharacterized protein
MNDEPWRRLRASGQPFVFAFWHGQMLPLLYQHRGEGVAVLISEHGDGEIIAQIALGLGYGTVRGSTSRGATRALVEMARAIDAGSELAITPDGPRGPARSVASGVLAVAHRSGAPIVPIGVWARRGWHLKSWDRFLIPRPFTRVQIAYGDPIAVRGSTAREAVADAPRLRDAMIEAERRARG